MAEVLAGQRDVVPSSNKDTIKLEEIIPDVIEERRKDELGRIISYKYQRGKLLGKGGFAKCYLGTSFQSKTQYALKIVAKSSLVKSRAKQKLQTEIKIHRTLHHIHVVRFERFFEDQNNAYMLLELCSNNSMSELLKRRKKLTEFETRYYLGQLVSSLKYLHAHLIIHRDLKLGNLFIDSDMRIKVGDFGLATRVAHVDERRKTICGTPNYIAPEILEGKDGHSFEVDVWSTGVIMYTLLIGKPPFEGKDVKSTYKRILANQYAFPDHTPICEHAKSLIRHMLQPRPERRPSLDQIMEHSFFTRPAAFMPTSLPDLALRNTPLLSDMLQSHNKVSEKAPSAAYGDENDPSAVNRVAALKTQESKPKLVEASIQRPRTAPAMAPSSSSAHTAPSAQPAVLHSLTDEDALSKGLHPSIRRSTRSAAASTLSSGTTSSAATAPSSGATNMESKSSVPSGVLSSRTSSRSSANVSDRGSYAYKFEIYQDSKTTTQVAQAAPVTSTISRSSASSHTTAPALASMRVLRKEENVDSLQREVTNMRLDATEKAPAPRNLPTSSSAFVAPVPTKVSTKPVDAWTWDDEVPDVVQGSTKVTLGPVQSTPLGAASTRDSSKPLDTLETMHKILNQSFTDLDKRRGTGKCDVDNGKSVARVWVVRYVDYTSKYGLGFLLSTGSAGVYFNDSTKIVLSADGTVFQYIERRRRDGSSASEHVSQTHLMSAYPMELQKKVTLLRHFRNYLIDQQKSQTPELNENGEVPVDAGQNMPMVLPEGTASGASSAIAFGVSSAAYECSEGERETGVGEGDGTRDMPFLKKWVRTRHAILFRLSNRVVQVVFFDRSEVLLSSEAQVITYVNKQGVREEHSLDEVLQTGRTDIAKRLRYTKDIMYRLINIAK